MKRKLLSLLTIISSTIGYTQFTINYTTATTPVTCHGGNDGTATITSISGGINFNNSNKGLLISEIFTDHASNDSPFEFVELVATRAINFASTPYTVIFCNNNAAPANGWVGGTTKTYAFALTSGSVTPGQVIYVGGSSMLPLTNQIRVINTGTNGGDGGIGSAVAAGVLGNGGASCDGVAVFNVAVASINASTVPIDAIFFGDAVGAAYISAGSGYQLPINDAYSGGKLDTVSYVIPLPASMQDKYIKASFGVYNTNTNTFTQPRTWSVTNTFTDATTSILLDGIYNVNWSNACTSVYNPNLAAGTYTFTISDALSNLTTGSVTVGDGFILQLNLTTPDTLACEGDVLLLSAANADVYNWSTGGNLSTETITVNTDTTIVLMGMDTTLGCVAYDSILIDVNPYPIVVFSFPADTICNDGGNISLNATPGGGLYAGAGVTGSTLDPLVLSGPNSITYTYTDENGCAGNDSVNYVVINCVGLEGVTTSTFSVYPNPAFDYLHISPAYETWQYTMTDLGGKIWSSGNLALDGKIPVQNQPAGMYFLYLFNQHHQQQIKFIKQ
jgi:hypothetical protein